MAAELVGGAFLSSLFEKLFDKLGSSEYLNFFRGLKLNDRLLKKLKIMLCSANQVLDDAELKQLTNPNAREWLFELKEAICVAEELLDDINYEILRYEDESKSGSSFKKLKSSLFSSCTTFDQAIQEILDMLEYIVKQKDLLGLKQGVKSIASQRLPAPLGDESSVYGRDDDKEKIMELLLSDNGSSRNKISVIPITGMGGIGKTTLAQLVYGDKRVQNQFRVRSWVIVSDESDVSIIAKKILEEITSKKCETEGLYQLQCKLEKELSGKMFLFVLDDVWNENYEQWDALLSSFRSGAHGSRIIVTTRSDNVANKMGNLPTYHLKTVSDDECWQLFADHAFKNTSSESYPELQAIGRDIVKKCKGVPLAVKSLAGLLRSFSDPNEWEKILNSDIWGGNLRDKLNKNILPSLWLSYHYLPSHLKRCFAYCSMFPKDYEMNELRKKELILLWMAEGLLQCPGNEEKRFEDVGEEYFQDLISRSLFQPLGKDKSTILMHDLIHDLAMFVSGEFSIRLDDNVEPKFSSKTRHFSYSKIEDCEKFDEVLSLAKRIHSFLQLPSRYYHCESPGRVSMLKTLLRVGGCLRALCPSQFVFIKLPDSIGNLKHLRYLDLSYNYDLEEIPNTLCGLYNLQTLRLTWCRKLTQLPTDMGNLVNLRHLCIEQVPLKKMPPKMRNLKDLRTLSNFRIGKNGGSSIEELGGLCFLSGALEISGLQNVDGIENVQVSYLKDKKLLSKLECCWSNNDRGDDSRKDKEVLDALQPHPKLKELVIDGYGVETLPSWLGHCSYNDMVCVRLTNCCNCRVLPPLGQLPSLQELYIYWCRGVDKIGAEFYSDSSFSNIKPFRSLKRLEFGDLSEWQQWSCPESREDGGCFPSLEHLSIRDCPKLNSCLPDYFPSLKTLEILGNEQIAILPGIQKMEMSFPRLDQLTIENCPNLETFLLSNLPSNLKEAYISGNVSFNEDRGSTIIGCTYVMEVLHPTTLTRLHIESLDNFNWEGFQHCHCLEELKIECCKELQRFPGEGLHVSLTSLCLTELPMLEDLGKGLEHLTSLKELSIKDCGNLQCLSENRLPTSLTSLNLYELPKLEDLGKGGLQHLISLKELRIEDCGNLQCLSENRLPTSLTSLYLWRLPKLEYLGKGGLQHLISLKELGIEYCGNLQCLSENRLPTSLTSLHLCRLPKLEDLGKGGLQHLISLKELGIEDCGNLQCLSENGLPTSLTSLHLRWLPKLEYLGKGGLRHLISLKELIIDNCENLQCLSKYGLPTSLTSLHLFQLPKLEDLGKVGLQHLISLKELRIGMCENFNQRCLSEYGLPTSLTSLHIVDLPSLEELGKNFFQRHIYLEGLSINNCKNLKYDSQEEENVKGGLKNFISLKDLTIISSEKLLGLLEEGLPPSLTSLKICWFQNVRDLNRMGFQDLISLGSLSIWSCSNLQCLPEPRLPSSLSSLDISDCPLLKPRCQKGAGDWHKISHITRVEIDGRRIA